jgi:hypothetical protein
MGFTVYYQSTESVDKQTRKAIAESLDQLCEGRSWISCEPPGFFGGAEKEGHLLGGSKPNFMPAPADFTNPEDKHLPDGTIQDVVDILCQLSNWFDVDWQFNHDHDEGAIGYIRSGAPDLQLKNEIAGIASIGGVVADALDHLPVHLPSRDPSVYETEEGEPRILKFGPLTTE